MTRGCSAGYICDFSNNDKTLSDVQGVCAKLVLNKTYSVGADPLLWNPQATNLNFSDENLELTIHGFDDECEKYNKNQGQTGCVDAGKITWYLTIKKNNGKIKFSVTSKRHESAIKKEVGYVFDFPDIDRFNLKIKIRKE